MTNRLLEMEATRDRTAGQLADLQRALDELNGSEELVTVQRMLAELDALQRLLAAQDRQLAVQYAAQREQEIAARDARRQLAATQAATIRAKQRDALFSLYDLAGELERVTGEFPELSISATRARSLLIDYMQISGVQFQTHGLGGGISPVRR